MVRLPWYDYHGTITITITMVPLPFAAGACSQRAHPRGVGGDDAEQQLPNLGRGRVFGGDESGDDRRRIQESGVRARQSPGLPHGTARKPGERMEEAVVLRTVFLLWLVCFFSS